MEKPKIGIFSLTGCGGDQLMILNMENILLELLSRFDIKDFQEASSYHEDAELDIAFVEGSVSTKTDLKKLRKIRDRSKILIALGDCAIGGCVQAMRNGQMSIAERMKKVYGVEEDYYDVLEPKGLSEYVKVDIEVPGCPIEKEEIFRVITSLLHGDMPEEIDYPMPCLGPVVTAGCNARCPSLGLDCIGCRGFIKDETNAAAELEVLLKKGYDEEYIMNRLRFFGGNFEKLKRIKEKFLERRKKSEGKK